MYTSYSTLPCNPCFIMIMDRVSEILDAARVKSYDDLQTVFQLCNQIKKWSISV